MARTPHDSFHDLALPDSLEADRNKGDQIREILELMVRALPPGALLPSERSIAERYQVARGKSPAAHILSARTHRAGAALAERLCIDARDRVIELRRLRSADGTPIAIEHTYLPARRFPGLTRVLRDRRSRARTPGFSHEGKPFCRIFER